jgi:steroid delta-isomerase-like uncharacterized protein
MEVTVHRDISHFGRFGAVATTLIFSTVPGCNAPRGQTPADSPSHSIGEHEMILERNKAVVRRIIEEAFNRGDVASIKPLVTPEFRSHNPRVPPGREGLEQFAQGFVDGFSDFAGEIREIVAEGDKVVVWVDWRGTHTGTFAGVAATGRRVEFATVEFFRLEAGQLAEHWDVADRLALQQGLGLIR